MKFSDLIDMLLALGFVGFFVAAIVGFTLACTNGISFNFSTAAGILSLLCFQASFAQLRR
jgi:hypothetical protein